MNKHNGCDRGDDEKNDDSLFKNNDKCYPCHHHYYPYPSSRLSGIEGGTPRAPISSGQIAFTKVLKGGTIGSLRKVIPN